MSASLWHAVTLIAVVAQVVACGGGGGDGPTNPPPSNPILAPTREMSYTGMPSIFDRRRNRFYALTPNQVIAVDPSTGSQTVLIADAADAPNSPLPNELYAGPFNQLALSASGDGLYVVTSTGKLARLKLSTGQIEQRLEPPPGPTGSTRRVTAVVASNAVDQDIYVAYAEIIPVDPLSGTVAFWLTKVEGTVWSQARLQLSPSGEVLSLKPDGSEILSWSGTLKKIRIGPNGALTYDSVEGSAPPDPIYTAGAPTYVPAGILLRNSVYDAATLSKSFDIPGAASCSALANSSHVICVGPGGPSHALFVYDLALRQVLSAWTAGLPAPASGLDPARPTGWVSEAGANRVVVHYAWNIYKGFNGTGLYSYSHASLN